MENIEVVRLEIPSSCEYVSIARQTVDKIARKLRFTSGEVEDLKLAVGEACTNAVKHGIQHDARITIRYIISPNELGIEVSNAVVDCTQPDVDCSLPDPAQMKEGGLGLYLMQRLMDEVELCWGEGLATVKMLKKLPKPRVTPGT